MLNKIKNYPLFHLSIFLILFFNFLHSGEEYDPISVYLTWTKKPDSTISIQWITPKSDTENSIFFRTLVQPNDCQDHPFLEEKGSHSPMPQGHPYLIHRVEISNLKPSSSYEFKIGKEGKLFKFKTMPEKLSTIKFVEGGDVYHDTIDLVEKMNIVAAKQNPDFAVIGGDIAYAADSSHGIFPEEIHRWMKWLVAWKKTMITNEGFLIPILPAIGNHETSGGFGKPQGAAPFFYALFPMPGEQGYNVLDFGDYMSLIILDSGHTNPISGKQSDWLKSTLQSRGNIPYKFAIYHVPAYPSARKHSYEVSQTVRQHWTPIFDTYSLKAAFEHHDHTYKRTHPLKNGKIDKNGVVYLGDGAWGVANPRAPKRACSYIAKTLSSSNFILVTLNEEAVTYEAYNIKGEIIDRYAQNK